ncbi:MAG TPA: hypothetical protein VIY54_09275 [Steroidobacteraceae bacterium]
MNYRIGTLVLLVAVVGLSGCHPFRALKEGGRSCRDANPYLAAGSIATLRIPQGLDAPDTSNALHIPQLNEPAPPPRSKTDPCLDEPPAFRTTKQAPPHA